ncbi:hypothetical protein [Bradyrhizobium sp. OAE829]|uniref:hypothetical protein n=1 Tax=Bradyrhizobium sp. OAE829 TaxID=2663807 RepID=UPI0017890161
MRRIALLGITFLAMLTQASAANDGCEKFAWSLARADMVCGIRQGERRVRRNARRISEGSHCN